MCLTFHLILPSPDSSLLISDFEPQPASAEAGTEDEFDPIPVTGRKNSQGKSLSSTGKHRWVKIILRHI